MNLHYKAISVWATPCVWPLNFSEDNSRELCASSFGESPIVLAQVNKYTVGFTDSVVEELDCPAQNSDLNPNKLC